MATTSTGHQPGSVPWHNQRPRRSGAARRQQELRASTRCIQRILRGVKELNSHRGCQSSKLGSALACLLQDSMGEKAMHVTPPAASPQPYGWQNQNPPQSQPSKTLGCSCGFTCGSELALEKHLRSVDDKTKHEPQEFNDSGSRLPRLPHFDASKRKWASQRLCKHVYSGCKYGDGCYFRHPEHVDKVFLEQVVVPTKSRFDLRADAGIFVPGSVSAHSSEVYSQGVFVPDLEGRLVQLDSEPTPSSAAAMKDVGARRSTDGRRPTPMPSSRGSSVSSQSAFEDAEVKNMRHEHGLSKLGGPAADIQPASPSQSSVKRVSSHGLGTTHNKATSSGTMAASLLDGESDKMTYDRKPIASSSAQPTGGSRALKLKAQAVPWQCDVCLSSTNGNSCGHCGLPRELEYFFRHGNPHQIEATMCDLAQQMAKGKIPSTAYLRFSNALSSIRPEYAVDDSASDDLSD